MKDRYNQTNRTLEGLTGFKPVRVRAPAAPPGGQPDPVVYPDKTHPGFDPNVGEKDQPEPIVSDTVEVQTDPVTIVYDTDSEGEAGKIIPAPVPAAKKKVRGAPAGKYSGTTVRKGSNRPPYIDSALWYLIGGHQRSKETAKYKTY